MTLTPLQRRVIAELYKRGPLTVDLTARYCQTTTSQAARALGTLADRGLVTARGRDMHGLTDAGYDVGTAQ